VDAIALNSSSLGLLLLYLQPIVLCLVGLFAGGFLTVAADAEQGMYFETSKAHYR
jgi:hypothetical protein